MQVIDMNGETKHLRRHGNAGFNLWTDRDEVYYEIAA